MRVHIKSLLTTHPGDSWAKYSVGLVLHTLDTDGYKRRFQMYVESARDTLGLYATCDMTAILLQSVSKSLPTETNGAS